MNDVVVTPAGPVPVRHRPGDLPVTFLLAHGAGAGMDHPWMVAMAERLAAAGFPTWTFDYAYTAAGRRAPDRLPKLLDVHEAVVAHVARDDRPLVLAGKSMGGRVGGHLAADRRVPIDGLVYLGYPLVPIGKAEARDTSHLGTVELPQLFVSGSRDRMGPLEGIAQLVESLPDARLHVIDDGDHSLQPRVATGRTLEDALDEATAVIVSWTAGRIAL